MRLHLTLHVLFTLLEPIFSPLILLGTSMNLIIQVMRGLYFKAD